MFLLNYIFLGKKTQILWVCDVTLSLTSRTRARGEKIWCGNRRPINIDPNTDLLSNWWKGRTFIAHRPDEEKNV